VYVVEAGLLAHGSVLLSGLPETLAGFSDIIGQRLAAYSCGGSAGISRNDRDAPASLLAPEKRFPKNHDGSTYRQHRVRVNSSTPTFASVPVFHSFAFPGQIFFVSGAWPIDTPLRI